MSRFCLPLGLNIRNSIAGQTIASYKRRLCGIISPKIQVSKLQKSRLYMFIDSNSASTALSTSHERRTYSQKFETCWAQLKIFSTTHPRRVSFFCNVFTGLSGHARLRPPPSVLPTRLGTVHATRLTPVAP